MTNVREQYIRVQIVILQVVCRLYDHFFRTQRFENQTFQKKSYLPGVKRFWPISSRIFDCDKPQGITHKGPIGILTITVEVIRSFL